MTITALEVTELVFKALKDLASRNKMPIVLCIKYAHNLKRFGELTPIALSDRVGVEMDEVRIRGYLTVLDLVVDVWDMHNNPQQDDEVRPNLADLKVAFNVQLKKENKLKDKALFGDRKPKDINTYMRG